MRFWVDQIAIIYLFIWKKNVPSHIYNWNTFDLTGRSTLFASFISNRSKIKPIFIFQLVSFESANFFFVRM